MAEKELPKDVAALSFEDALEELKSIVQRLEAGEGKLDEAIDAYQRGAALKAHCDAKLRDAQQKIEKISLSGGASAGGAPIGVEPLDRD